MDKAKYTQLVKKTAPKSKVVYDCVKAFWVGGTICLLGEIIAVSIMYFFELEREIAGTWTSIILVFLSAFLTGIGLYAKIGAYAGAGSIVPITGFANGVASPAIEFKTEGWVLGLGAKMFIIAGPVIVYGTVSSVAYGIIYWIMQMI